MSGSWTCHHCEAEIPADRGSWWHVEADTQHVYCSEEHAASGCRKEHPE